jgi:hypothetical protein
MGRDQQRRGAIFKPTQKLFSVLENVCGLKIKLSAGGLFPFPFNLSAFDRYVPQILSLFWMTLLIKLIGLSAELMPLAKSTRNI